MLVEVLALVSEDIGECGGHGHMSLLGCVKWVEWVHFRW